MNPPLSKRSLYFRKALGPGRIAQLHVRLPLHPVPTLLGIASLLGIAASTFFVPGLEYTIPTFCVFLGAITLAYWIQFRAKKREDRT